MEKELKFRFVNPEEPLQDYPGLGRRVYISKEEAVNQLPHQPECSKRKDGDNKGQDYGNQHSQNHKKQ